jgi:hypothetical protein
LNDIDIIFEIIEDEKLKHFTEAPVVCFNVSNFNSFANGLALPAVVGGRPNPADTIYLPVVVFEEVNEEEIVDDALQTIAKVTFETEDDGTHTYAPLAK